jgi:hypothetical protein
VFLIYFVLEAPTRGNKDYFNTGCLLLILIYIKEVRVNLSRIISLIPDASLAAERNNRRVWPQDKLVDAPPPRISFLGITKAESEM